MTKVIAVINQKGGVGKTTTVANLGYALANRGRDVLLIDFDSQASLTNYFNVGLVDQNYYSVYEMLVKELRPIPEAVDAYLANSTFNDMFEDIIIRPTYIKTVTETVDGKKMLVDKEAEFGISLLPSKLELSDYELELSDNQGANGFHLSNIIKMIKEWHNYDYILIDCNPSLGVLTMNALFAATDGILIPTNLDIMSTRGVKNLINKIVEVQEALINNGSEHYGIIGIVLNLYCDWRTVDRRLKDDMNEFYPFKIFDEKIPESINAKKAVLTGVTYSQMYKKAEVAYRNLAKEFEERLQEMKEEGPKIMALEENFEVDGALEDSEMYNEREV